MSVKLTKREIDVATLISQGLPNKEIAFRLGLALGTIKEYLYKIYRKLGVCNRTELAMWTLRKERERSETPCSL